jgi:hypothetical protein
MNKKLLESCLFLSESKKKLDKIPLTSKEREEVKSRFGNDLGCSFFKNNEGKFFCTTHRARSKFYDSIQSIPKKTVEFISSTS